MGGESEAFQYLVLDGAQGAGPWRSWWAAMVGASDEEIEFCEAVAGMLARPDFLIPLVAAERQFRDHYYGLNSAALLEDLFFDALGNFLRQTRPGLRLSRPSPGQTGWDYEFEGLHFSHKVSQKLGDIAAIWDATKQGVATWSFQQPIVYVLGTHSPPAAVHVDLDGESLTARALPDLKRPERLAGRTALLVDWPAGSSQPMVLKTVTPSIDGPAREQLPFSEIWSTLADFVSQGRAANEFDVLVTNKILPPLARELLSSAADGPKPADLSVTHRAGVYVLTKSLLQDLAVKTNNRAVLIPRSTVSALLTQALEAGLFVPLSQWYATYAQVRPPDLYSAQRAEYDSLFSARGRHS